MESRPPALIDGRAQVWRLSHIRRHPPFYKGREQLSIIRRSGYRFSEKIMLKQRDEIVIPFNLTAS
jgi:hypothetical protein